MTVLHPEFNRENPVWLENHSQMKAAIQEFREAERQIILQENKAKPKFDKRGQLLPRERLALLLDRGSPFLELSSLAGRLMHDDTDGSGAGGGIICGIGTVSGVCCMVMASNSAVKGGTVSPAGLSKSLRAQEIALENKLPVVFLVESGGANLQYQSEIFIQGGRGFANQARLSAAGIPQITVVHGSSTAGGAYFPGMSDYVIMVRNKARVFLAGPPLLRAATGEIATEEELGGAEMHAGIAGTAEYLAEDDRDALRLAREVVDTLGWDEQTNAQASREIKDPLYPSEDLLGFVPVDFRQNYDVRQVIACLVDGSRFLEFKSGLDGFTICGHARLSGFACGLIGNNGPITHKGAAKAAQFIQLCCQSNTPIIYLQNTTGYMVGVDAEQNGIIKHGSKMLQAVANASVPQITLVIGGSFGAGNYGMCGRGMGPRFIFSWPNARIGVMGSDQAAGVMSMITRAKMQRAGAVDETVLKAMEQKIKARMEEESTALFGTARLWDDGIIDPRDSRAVLQTVLAICRDAEERKLQSNTFGIARL